MAIALTAVLLRQPHPASADAVSGNNDFANAWAITTIPFVGTQNTVGMTTETGEPLDPNSCVTAVPHVMGATVWYSFTSTSDQNLTADTVGSDYDTVLAVYTGSAVNALTPVACNDDIGPSNLASRVNFAAANGTTYYLQVGGFNSATGNLVFNLALAPTPTPTPTPCPTEKVPVGGGGCGTPTPTNTPTITPTPCPTQKVPFGGGCGTPTPTPVPPDFSIGVDLNGDTTDDCATKVGAPSSTCYLLPGTAFTLKAYLNNLGAAPSYVALELDVTYNGVISKDNASTLPWPQCAFPASFYSTGHVAWGCVGGNSTYTGLIGTNGFNCPSTDSPGGHITLHHGQSGTNLTDKSADDHFEAEGSTEALTINCLFPTPTSTPTVTPTPKSSPTPKATPTTNPTANGSLRIDADCEQPLGPPKDASIQSKRYVLLGSTFHVCVYATSPTGSASGYQAQVHWSEGTLDLNARSGGQNDVWHLQAPASGGPPNGAGIVQTLGPADDGVGSDAYVLLTTKDSANQNSSPPYNGPVAQFEFVCQQHAAANIELTLPGDSGGSLLFSGVSQLKPALKGATIICLDPSYDSDIDGCTNAQELGPDQAHGGQRDPYNHSDYFNPTHDGKNRIDDILKVVSQFHLDDTDGNPGLPPYTLYASTLNGALSDVATTINVVSTTGARGADVIQVDAERIKYTMKTATSFTGATRGFDGTVAASHLTGAAVGGASYNPDTDRTLLGPNAWNLGPPNGQQRVDDILNAVHQFHHDCS